jgi:epoxyqueuosine reductase
LTGDLQRLATDAGFARVGVAPAGPVAGERAFRDWLETGSHAGQEYLTENVDLRFEPGRLVENARSVICLAVSYHPGDLDEPDGAFIARYARGRDYHRVLKQRAWRLCDRLRELEPGFAARAFVDTAPLAERSLAARAGLGWIGRHGNLIVPGLGSYVLLAEIVCNLDLPPGRPRDSGCGDCSKCLAACPTGALVVPAVVDCRRCLSCQTIENRGSIPRDLWEHLGRRVFGCDACQSACPHNRNRPAGDPELLGQPEPASVALAEIIEWDETDWDVFTRGSARRRATHAMWLRNAVLAAGSTGLGDQAGALRKLRGRREDLREEIDWALGCLAETDGV